MIALMTTLQLLDMEYKMRRFNDFILVDEKLTKSEKKVSTLEKAKMIKEKLADANDFMNDPSNDATKKTINYTNKAEVKKDTVADPLLMSYNDKKKSEELRKPWASDAQRKWGHTESGKEALGEKTIKEFDDKSKGKDLPAKASKSQALKCYNDMKSDTKKNDPEVSGTVVTSNASGELGNKNKQDESELNPAKDNKKEPMLKPIKKEPMAQPAPMKKSMSQGGLEWSQDDLQKGYLAFAGGINTGMAIPNYSAQPLVPQESKKSNQNREVSLAQALDMLDDSNVKV